MSFESLSPSRVEVLRQVRTRVNGALRVAWDAVPGSQLTVRFDLGFVRPGRGQLPPIQAGVQLDRTGLMFADREANAVLRAGDRLRAISGPVSGIFEIRNIPDLAMGYGAAHHLEVEVTEVAQRPSASYVEPSIPVAQSALRHLYASRAEVLERQTVDPQAGTDAWVKRTEILDPTCAPGELMCRLDLGFVRPGKDQLPAIVAGRAADRVGVLFCDITPYLRAGDRLRCIGGDITGTFEIRVVPDLAPNLAQVHHLEVQIVEVAQALAGVFPGGVGQ